MRATVLLLVLLAPAAHAGCGDAGEEPCRIDGGEYHIVMPDGADDAVPAVVFLHGWGSSGAGVLSNTGIVDAVLERGYALIAPDGMPRQGGAGGGTWSFHPDWPQARDESEFLTAVADDAARRHGIDGERIILSGFSIGGSMTSYLACEVPDAFAAYAPVGGSFWRPHPDGCAGPVRVLHTHGWTDTTVPLEGRYLRNGEIAQGDVFRGMEIWRETNGCDAMRADEFQTDGAFWHRRWDRCDDEAALEFVLFPGGHLVPQGWAPMMLDWFETL